MKGQAWMVVVAAATWFGACSSEPNAGAGSGDAGVEGPSGGPADAGTAGAGASSVGARGGGGASGFTGGADAAAYIGGQAGTGMGGQSGSADAGGAPGGMAGARLDASLPESGVDPDATAGAGGTAGGGGAGTDGSPPTQACSTDADCTSGRCDQLIDECVECLFHTDCGRDANCEGRRCIYDVGCRTLESCVAPRSRCDSVLNRCVACDPSYGIYGGCTVGQRCVDNVCVPHEQCVNSLDCAGGTVCVSGACVECGIAADCGAGLTCIGNACVPACDSDLDCVPMGKLCNTTAGACVRCKVDTDCPAAYHCTAAGECVIDVCESYREDCYLDFPYWDFPTFHVSRVRTCNAAGSAMSTTETCSSSSVCDIDDTGDAFCRPRDCVPGDHCSSDTTAIVYCNDWGTELLSTTPCAAGTACYKGAACTTCSPGDGVCSPDGTIQTQCNAMGEWEAPAPCPTGELCLYSYCEEVLCTPGNAFCAGSSVYRCDPQGVSATLEMLCPVGCDSGTCNATDAGLSAAAP